MQALNDKLLQNMMRNGTLKYLKFEYGIFIMFEKKKIKGKVKEELEKFLAENPTAESFENFLKEHKLSVQASDSDGNTLLHYVANSYNKDVFKFLIDKGANPNAENKAGQRIADIVYLDPQIKNVISLGEEYATFKREGKKLGKTNEQLLEEFRTTHDMTTMDKLEGIYSNRSEMVNILHGARDFKEDKGFSHIVQMEDALKSNDGIIEAASCRSGLITVFDHSQIYKNELETYVKNGGKAEDFFEGHAKSKFVTDAMKTGDPLFQNASVVHEVNHRFNMIDDGLENYDFKATENVKLNELMEFVAHTSEGIHLAETYVNCKNTGMEKYQYQDPMGNTIEKPLEDILSWQSEDFKNFVVESYEKDKNFDVMKEENIRQLTSLCLDGYLKRDYQVYSRKGGQFDDFAEIEGVDSELMVTEMLNVGNHSDVYNEVYDNMLKDVTVGFGQKIDLRCAKDIIEAKSMKDNEVLLHILRGNGVDLADDKIMKLIDNVQRADEKDFKFLEQYFEKETGKKIEIADKTDYFERVWGILGRDDVAWNNWVNYQIEERRLADKDELLAMRGEDVSQTIDSSLSNAQLRTGIRDRESLKQELIEEKQIAKSSIQQAIKPGEIKQER